MTKAALTDETGLNSLDPKSAPVVLPAASFNLDHLTSGLDKAAEGLPEKRAAAVYRALSDAMPRGAAAAGARQRIKGGDSSLLPGFKTVQVEHETIKGLKEKLRVFDPGKADEQAPDQPVASTPIAPSASAQGE